MKDSKLGDGWKFRDKEPENKTEIIQLFISEVEEFKHWAKTVSIKRKESIFWECDYDNQLYLDIVLELLFINFRKIEELSQEVINEIIFVIARNHEQGNIFAWKNQDIKISYLGMDENQFRFLAERIEKDGEINAKFQVPIVYQKFKYVTQKDIEILKRLAKSDNEYISKQSIIALEKLDNKK